MSSLILNFLKLAPQRPATPTVPDDEDNDDITQAAILIQVHALQVQAFSSWEMYWKMPRLFCCRLPFAPTPLSLSIAVRLYPLLGEKKD
jgi:hypothetical protein